MARAALPSNQGHIATTMRWPPHVHNLIHDYARQNNISFSYAAIILVTRGLEHQRAAGNYLPPPTIGCTYTTEYPSSLPCNGPITHTVIYRGPSGREQSRNTVCEAHQAEALQRPAATGARIIAELEPLPDVT